MLRTNQPLKVEIKVFFMSHFLEQKTAPLDRPDAGPTGHVECPQSEPASNDRQFTRCAVGPGDVLHASLGSIERQLAGICC